MKRLLVTVGTDHHRFDRLVRWADGYATDHPDVEVFVQYGDSVAPRVAQGSRLLDHTQLNADLAQADAVVVHGGPATIAEARRLGQTPICVPRDPARGEHVDEHQLRFAEHLSRNGLVEVCLEVGDLGQLVDTALASPKQSSATTSDDLPPAAWRIAELLNGEVPPAASDSPVPVLYIGGQGRSGSTILERAVAELPGIIGVGEIVHLWQRGLRDNELCGCGEPFHACPFWTEVGEVGFGGWDTLNAEEVVDLRYRVDRNRFLPLMLRPSLNNRYYREYSMHVERLAALYQAIARVSGAKVLVDSSKHASYALLLSQTPGIDLRVLHLVRDSPAVVHAWSREVPRPEATDSLMPLYGPVKASALWDAQNVIIEALRRRHPYLRVRYEDFVTAPKDTLLDIARFADPGEPDPSLPFLDGDTIELGSSHSVAGNPMRFSTGPIEIRRDDGWRSHMPASKRRTAALLTAPLRRHYGYGQARP